MKTLLVSACAAALLLASGASATQLVDHYTLDHDGVRMEISAPRADIIRVRAGKGALPEDASWAVKAGITRTLFDVSDAGAAVEISNARLTVRIDKATLSMTVSDKSGRVILADAPGSALSFENGGFRVRKAMPEDEHYFGLGDKTGPLDRRGGAFTNWNSDTFGYGVATDPIYKSIPFVMGVDESGHSFGLFMDNTWRSFFDMGKSERDAFAFGAEGGPVDYYIMTGDGPKDIVEDYAYLTGKAPLTPEWALGFQQSHWGYMTQAEVKGIADRLRADRLPADVVYMDIDYQDRNRPFTVNTKAFPDLGGLVAQLKAQNLHLVLITDLHVAYAPNQGYAPYDSGAAQNLFVRKADGSTFVGPVWPGDAVFPDFSRPKARDWWGQQYKAFVGMGVYGFWNDMNEPSVFNTRSKTMPLDNLHRIEEPGFKPRDATHAEMHNVFGMLNTEGTYEGVLKLSPDTRPFVLTRATYAGGQRYAATWTGDNTSSWAHLRLSTSQLVNLGLSGFAYAGDDIGGFAGEQPPADLLTKWIEVGAFNPIFRDHYQKGKAAQEPWVSGPEHENIRRHYIEERYRLMPYIYALAEENSRTGLPMMRPVFLEYPKSVAVDGVADQFMLGRNLLIAPAPNGESPAAYDVNLPGEGWFDYWTGEKVAAAFKETPKLERLPVFVRPGSIIAKQPLVQSTLETPQGALELHVYPGPDCTAQLYFDDGTSFAYTRGVFLRQTVSCRVENGALHVALNAREGSYRPWWTGISLVVHGWSGKGATLNGKALKADVSGNSLVIGLPDIAKASDIVVAP